MNIKKNLNGKRNTVFQIRIQMKCTECEKFEILELKTLNALTV